MNQHKKIKYFMFMVALLMVATLMSQVGQISAESVNPTSAPDPIRFEETFDGDLPYPEPWVSSVTWDVTTHSRDINTWYELEPVNAQHGPDCSPPPEFHVVTEYANTSYICKDHMMTALSAEGYGLIYFTPNVQADFSNGDAVISFDASTKRTSTRDWIDIWITPYDRHLQMPLEWWLPDLTGEPKDAIHVRMDANEPSKFYAEIIRDFEVTRLNGTPDGWMGFESFLEPDFKRRDTFELTISTQHIKFGMPDYDFYWVDEAISHLGWDQGVVQIGYHSYNPEKACDYDGTCSASTIHWDNVVIDPAIPFTMIPSKQRYMDNAYAFDYPWLDFGSPAPEDSYLRFVAAGRNVEISYDNGVNWVSAELQPQAEEDNDAIFKSYWTPAPEGTEQVMVRAEPWPGGDWMVRDISIWSLADPSIPVDPPPPPDPGGNPVAPPQIDCVQNGLSWEQWSGIDGADVAELTSNPAYPYTPDAIQTLTDFDAPRELAEDYGARLRGYIIPPQSGNYQFFISGDDEVELWLSSSEKPTDAKRLAYTPNFTSYQQFNKFVHQRSASVYLEAGAGYYVEALHKEDFGSDHLSVAWSYEWGEAALITNENLCVYPNAAPPDPVYVYVSSTTPGNVNGFNFADEDILLYDPIFDTWSMHFDGSDVGLNKNDIDGFTFLDDGSILFSFTKPHLALADVGDVDDSDIIRFVPTSLGVNTAGSFELYFDGSDVGLTENSEDIDAITILPTGQLVLSPLGYTKVGDGDSVKARDEDLLLFTPTTLGADTSGSWDLYWEGRDSGFFGNIDEDIWGVSLGAAPDQLYLTMRGQFEGIDIGGAKTDIFICNVVSYGSNTECDFYPLMSWRGHMHDFGDEYIDGFVVVPAVSAEP